MSRFTRAAGVFGGAALLTLALWAFLPLLWGWEPVVVTSGSMAPSIRTGDLVLLDRTATPGVGDVIVYQRPGEPAVSHRVIAVDAAGNRLTKGDANPQADPQPVPPGQVLGRVRMLVPLLGLPGLALRHAAVAGGLLVGAAALGWAAVARRCRRLHRAAVATVVLIAGTVFPAAPARAKFTGGTTNAVSAATRSQFYPVAVMAAGPAAYWRLGESSGFTRADATGNVPLNCFGATAGVAGALSKDANTATRLPAATAHCDAANGSLVSLSGSFTVIAWERATIWPETFFGRIVAKFGGSAGTLNYMLAWDSAGTSMRALIDTSSGRYQAIKAMTASTAWHQIVMTWDGAAVRLYIDGAPADGLSITGTVQTTSSPVHLGYTGSDSMVGDIDEVAIFTRAMGNAEIAALYALA